MIAKIIDLWRTGNFCRNIFVGDQGQDEVQGQNGDSQAGGGIAEEAQALGQVEFLSGSWCPPEELASHIENQYSRPGGRRRIFRRQ